MEGAYRFSVEFLGPVLDFFQELDQKTKEKILYNVWKTRHINDPGLLKKLDGEIWEFRTLYNRKYIRLFAFWDHTSKDETIVIATHSIIKKTAKVPRFEIERATLLRTKYFYEKYRP